MSTAREKEAWIDDAIASMEGIKRVQPNDDTFEKIIYKVNNVQTDTPRSSSIMSRLLFGIKGIKKRFGLKFEHLKIEK
jgi:hypothetical protein